MPLFEIKRRLVALEARSMQFFREGLVVSTDPAKGTARVRIPDADDLITNNLRVLTRKTAEDQDYWMPDIGDGVCCLFLGNGLENGVILGSFYSTPAPVPVVSQDKRHIRFKDGTWLEYDRAAHVLTADVQGRAVINTTQDIAATAGTGIAATAGADITAQAGGKITASAGASIEAQAPAFISLTAPLISLNGNVTGGGSGGAGGNYTAVDNANRIINGDLTINGNLKITGNSDVGGGSRVGGNSYAATRSGGPVL